MERLQTNSSLMFSRSKNWKTEGERPVTWISRVGAELGWDWAGAGTCSTNSAPGETYGLCLELKGRWDLGLLALGD